MRPLLFTLFWLLSVAAAATTIYKWVDENGVTHYSDQPFPGATKIELSPAQTYSAPPPPATSGPARSARQQPQRYELCEISRPANDQVFFNVQSVEAMVRVEPGLNGGHQVAVALDGKRLPQVISPGAEFTLSPVFRGTHTLRAVIEDQQGRVLCESAVVTFHVRQPSVQAPNPANRPRF